MQSHEVSLRAMQLTIHGKKVRVGGIAKGSGMIHPNMATLLSVVTTDAKVAPDTWSEILRHAAHLSFNQVCVQQLSSCFLTLDQSRILQWSVSAPRRTTAVASSVVKMVHLFGQHT